jgi:hypothetical protein
MSSEKLGRVLTIAKFELEKLINLCANADRVVVGRALFVKLFCIFLLFLIPLNTI